MHPEAVREQLDKILASATFQTAARSGKLLRFLVERTLDGHAEELKEYTLGAEALGRGEQFDPKIDSIARVEASRLRSKLDLYYATEGRTDPIRITLPKGTYVPDFQFPPPTEGVRLGGAGIALGLALAVVAALATAWAIRKSAPVEPKQAARFEVDLGPAASLQSSQVGSSSVIVSPRGDRLVFVSFREGVPRLMTLVLDPQGPSTAVELPGTEGARGPFFSPSGEWVAFLAGGKLKKVQIGGGPPLVLCDSPELLGGSWGEDDWIVAALTVDGLRRIPAGGGEPRPIDGWAGGTALWPQVLPGAKAVLFTSGRPAASPQSVSVFSLSDRDAKILIRGASYGRYLASGHLAYLDNGTVFVVPFDVERLEVTGPRVALLRNVAFTPGFGSAEFDVSQGGLIAYRRSADNGRSVIAWLDAKGNKTPVLSEPAAYMWPRISPDGSKFVFTLGDRPEQTLRVQDWRTGRSTQVLFGNAASTSTVWTPDGNHLITSNHEGGLVWLRADGGGSPQPLIEVEDVLIPWSFSPLGRLAIYRRGTDARGSVTFDLWTLPVRQNGEGLVTGALEPFLVSDAFEIYPEFSPDGRWLAYNSLESGSYEIYVRPFPDNGRKWQISNHGGGVARWTRDGRLFYRSLDHRIMVVDYSVRGGDFVPSSPRIWIEEPLADTGIFPNFDVGPDNRILALLPAPGAAPPQDPHHVTVLLNAFDEINRLSAR